MNKKIIGGVILVVVVSAIIYGMMGYNSLITAHEAIDTQWSKVETQYARRFDLIPNLVNTVKGIMKQEETIFTAIAQARTQYAGARTVNEKVQSATALDSAVSRLLMISENYPQLASNQNAQALMAELAGTENRISVERSRFNDTVQVYNLSVKRFPSSLVASLFGFDERPYFKAPENAAQVPQVNF